MLKVPVELLRSVTSDIAAPLLLPVSYDLFALGTVK